MLFPKINYIFTILLFDIQVTGSTKYTNTEKWIFAENDGLLTSKSRLAITARHTYFPGGRMIVRCESNQFELYKKYSVIELTDDSPRLAQMISPTTNVFSTGMHRSGIKLITVELFYKYIKFQ